jgi:hypothetical protein
VHQHQLVIGGRARFCASQGRSACDANASRGLRHRQAKGKLNHCRMGIRGLREEMCSRLVIPYHGVRPLRVRMPSTSSVTRV